MVSIGERVVSCGGLEGKEMVSTGEGVVPCGGHGGRDGFCRRRDSARW